MFLSAIEPTPLRLRRLWQTIGFCLIGFVVWASLATDPISLPGSHGDKYGHVFAYLTLMFWFAQLHAGNAARVVWVALFVAMGVALEFAQRLTDYRTFDVYDMVADAVGVLLGWFAAPPRTPHLIRFIETHLLPA